MGAAESHIANSQGDEKKIMDVDESAEYFSAKLLVGDGAAAESLLPISHWKEQSEDEEAAATFAYYCAEPGVRFVIKCQLLRPPPEGVAYGARVYVDSGDKDVVYTSAGLPGTPEAEEDDVDTSTPDHYFWFGPGQTEYVVKGFYADSQTSWPFVFGSAAARRASSLGGGARANAADGQDAPPPKKRARESVDRRDVAAAKSVGVVRVQFAKVQRWLKPIARAPSARRKSMEGAAAALADRKGARVVAKAGAVAEPDRAGAKEAAAREAVLSPKIIHECRVHYNDFAGYRSQATIGRAMLEPLTFQGLPLSALRQVDVRRRAIETFLRSLQREGSEKATTKRIWRWSAGTSAKDDDADPAANAPVKIAKLAEFLCKTLSPAAARLVCTGAAPPGDASLYQTFAGLSDADRVADLEANAAALSEYLTNRPDLYHVTTLKTSGGGWFGGAKAEHAVAFAELVIE